MLSSPEVLLAVLAGAVQAGTPLLFATLGEIITERSGVLNLGVEGMMIVGAFFGFLGLHLTGSPWLGVCAGAVAGAGMASIHGALCVTLRCNQVVSGLALTILGLGLADFLGAPYMGQVTEGFKAFSIPGLCAIPVLGPILFRQDALVYLSYFLPPLLWFFLRYTSWGLGLRAAGENPAAVTAAGLNVIGFRWAGVLAGGVLAGIGGAYLSLAYTHMWTNNITAGRGWIAVALVIFAFWRPLRAVVGAYLFSGIIMLQMNAQAHGTNIPSSLLDTLPYAFTLAALVFSSVRGKGRGAPAYLGVNQEPSD
ncbi:ABC transporter permease [Desulfovibrio sp. OttesenSCG-928-O18]|nr:ABC transporter permease [Desulfovibrio sp. OttesenSCG-928-O18]